LESRSLKKIHGLKKNPSSPDFFRAFAFQCWNWKIFCDDHYSRLNLQLMTEKGKIRVFSSGWYLLPYFAARER